MLKSMTGYGYGEVVAPERKVIFELKAVNHRYCEIVLRLPRHLASLEDRIRRLIQSRVTRGRIDGYLNTLNHSGKTTTVKVDKNLAVAYYKAMIELQSDTAAEGNISLQYLAGLPGVLHAEETPEDAEEWWPLARQSVEKALDDLIRMRATEGEILAVDIFKRLERLTTITKRIIIRSPEVVEEYKKRLANRLKEFFQEGGLDHNRLAAEAALFAERSNITEETVRIESHLKQVFACLETGEPVGRKLDFLIQEMNREINTIASKASDIEIGRLVVEAKGELEKIREQAQNIE